MQIVDPMNHSIKDILEVSELAYLAGFFDGEGCISIGRSLSDENHQYKHGGGHRLMVQVVQTHPVPLDDYLKRWGGSIWQRKEPKGNRKPIWCWRLFKQDAVEKFCRETLPFLRLKGPQVEACLEYLKTTVDPTGQRYNSHNVVPHEVWERREDLYRQLRALKKVTIGVP